MRLLEVRVMSLTPTELGGAGQVAAVMRSNPPLGVLLPTSFSLMRRKVYLCAACTQITRRCNHPSSTLPAWSLPSSSLPSPTSSTLAEGNTKFVV
jgi:hypothetical protein